MYVLFLFMVGKQKFLCGIIYSVEDCINELYFGVERMKSYGFPMALLANLLIWVFIGFKVDEWLHTSPIFVLVGLFYSLFGTIYLYYKKMRKNDE